MNEYASKIDAEVDAHIAEQERLEAGDSVSADCHYIGEVLGYIRVNGPTTVNQLSRTLRLQFEAMGNVVTFMRKHKLITTVRGERGKAFVHEYR